MAEETKDKVVSEQDGKGNENKAETANAEAPKKEEAKTDEKKESGFSKWWKGTKAKVDSDMHVPQHRPRGVHHHFGGKAGSYGHCYTHGVIFLKLFFISFYL